MNLYKIIVRAIRAIVKAYNKKIMFWNVLTCLENYTDANSGFCCTKIIKNVNYKSCNAQCIYSSENIGTKFKKKLLYFII